VLFLFLVSYLPLSLISLLLHSVSKHCFLSISIIYSPLSHSFLPPFSPAACLRQLCYYDFICFSRVLHSSPGTVSEDLLIDKFLPPWRNAELNYTDKPFVFLQFFSIIEVSFLIPHFILYFSILLQLLDKGIWAAGEQQPSFLTFIFNFFFSILFKSLTI
jgi:hypothetical protein